MGIETYILITATYALGCFLSYRQGVRMGIDLGVKKFSADIQKVLKLPNEDMIILIKKVRDLGKKPA